MKIYVIIICFLSVSSVSSAATISGSNSTYVKYFQERVAFLEELFKGYDARIPPNIRDVGPTTVTINLLVISVDSVNEATMDYTASIYFRQRWVDPRLAYGNTLNETFITLDAKTAMNNIWVPDSFFTNEKTGRFHDVTVPNRLLRIYFDGRVLYSMRLSLTLSCQMNLGKFPMDSQHCPLKIESYAFLRTEIDFEWLPDPVTPAVEVNVPLEMAQFIFKGVKIGVCHAKYSTGSFACLNATLHLERNIGFYMIQTFVPSILIVILSWVSFWINHESVPARISLGVLCVLTMTTQSSGSRLTLPRVSYIKAIDVWMSTCLLFVFAALVEYAVVNVVARENEEEQKVIVNGNHKNESYHDNMYGSPNFVVEPKLAKKKKQLTTFQKAKRADEVSQKLFPCAFVLFNIIFWITYFVFDFAT